MFNARFLINNTLNNINLKFFNSNFINFKLSNISFHMPLQIEFVKTIKTTPLDQATYLLEVWIEDAENPKPEDLIYILEEIKLFEAANILKSNS